MKGFKVLPRGRIERKLPAFRPCPALDTRLRWFLEVKAEEEGSGEYEEHGE